MSILLPAHVGCCNVGYPPETHLKFKSRDISFDHNLLLSHQIVLKFCTEHGSITAVLGANFQNDLAIDIYVMDERDFARFKLKMTFGRLSHIALSSWFCASDLYQQAFHIQIICLQSNNTYTFEPLWTWINLNSGMDK